MTSFVFSANISCLQLPLVHFMILTLEVTFEWLRAGFRIAHGARIRRGRIYWWWWW